MTYQMRAFEDVPKHVAIELTSHCNRDCWFCPRFGDRSGKRKYADGTPVIKFMPTEHVVPLMQQVWDMGYRNRMNFHHLSEAYLDKRLHRFAREAINIGFECMIHTNGDVLRQSKELAREAVDLFAEITVGLYDYKTEDERIAEEEFWTDHLAGAKSLHFTRHDIVFPRHDIDPTGPRMEGHKKAVEAARPHRCEMVREHMIVHHDGNVALCCEDYIDQFGLGSAFERPLSEIWWSDARRKALDTLSRPGGRMAYPHCMACPYAPSQHLYTIDKAGSSVEEDDGVFPRWVDQAKSQV